MEFFDYYWMACTSLIGAPILIYNILFSPAWPSRKPLGSKEEIDHAIKEEAAKIGLDASNIDVIYDYGRLPYVTKKENRILMNLSTENLRSRAIIRHELAHAKNDNLSGRSLHYFFVDEPRAALYETFGIKWNWKN